MDYQTVAQKVSDFIKLKAQIMSMQEELAQMENQSPQPPPETLTWEEAVQFAQSREDYTKTLETLRMGIANRQEIIQNKEDEIGRMLPLQDHYILFKLFIDGQEETYKIGYFPASYGFRMEKVIPENPHNE